MKIDVYLYLHSFLFQVEIDYDYLVVAVGCEPATFGIPGVHENAGTSTPIPNLTFSLPFVHKKKDMYIDTFFSVYEYVYVSNSWTYLTER